MQSWKQPEERSESEGKRREAESKGTEREAEIRKEGSGPEGNGKEAEERGTEQGERTKGSKPSEEKQVTAG